MNRNIGFPTIVVVGAAGGIGKQVVIQLQSHARIVAVVQNAVQVSEVAPLADHCVECDLTDSQSVQTVIASITANCGNGINGLVFCAAMQPIGPLELVGRPALERLFAVNVFGSLQLVQGLIPSIRKTKGRIVLFSSLAGRVASPMLGAYSATKFSLEAIADVLRRELAPSGVGVSLIEPGGVETPMATAQAALVDQCLAGLDPAQEKHYGRLIRGYGALTQAALRHASSPEKVARCAVKAVMGPGKAKARCAVGTDAKLMILLSRLLPGRWFDALLTRITQGG